MPVVLLTGSSTAVAVKRVHFATTDVTPMSLLVGFRRFPA